MATDPFAPLPTDPLFPGVDPAVVAAYRAAPEHMVAEILDGELSLLSLPRLRRAHGATIVCGRLRGFYDPDEGEPGGWAMPPSIVHRECKPARAGTNRCASG